MVTAEDLYTQDASVGSRIRKQIERNVAHYAMHIEQIEARLRELDREWTAEKTLESAGAALALGGLVMASFGARRWLMLPLAMAGLALQHSLRGRTLPLEFLRALGVRTREEIEVERTALKALRGDFNVPADATPERRATVVLRAVT